MPRQKGPDRPTDRDAAPGPVTHFGNREVSEEEKTGLVRDLFERVAHRYDLMNDLMSLGVHRRWKRIMVDCLPPRPSMWLLDVGGGTGDLAFRFLGQGGGRATVVDPSVAMLVRGRERAVERGILTALDWLGGEAEALPIADGSVDAYAAAFSLRNMTRADAALSEARRVLKPGGRFLSLEFSHMVVPLLERAYHAYSSRVVPALGALVAGDRDAYRYLVDSIRRFPDQETLAAEIRRAGLERVTYRNLSGGVVAIHSAWRI